MRARVLNKLCLVCGVLRQPKAKAILCGHCSMCAFICIYRGNSNSSASYASAIVAKLGSIYIRNKQGWKKYRTMGPLVPEKNLIPRKYYPRKNKIIIH